MFIYIYVGIVCLYEFGSALTANVLNNVNMEIGSSISYIIRFAFLLVLACHIPYIFFTGKESLLIIILEAYDCTMSKTIEK
jgi:hypothetical protein